MICSDCGKEDFACECDIVHYIKTGEKRSKRNPMTTLNRELHKALGKCWHDSHRPDPLGEWQCKKCKRIIDLVKLFYEPPCH